MHKFKVYPIDIDDNLKNVGKGLHEPKKTFFAAESGNLRKSFVEYAAHAKTIPVSLETMHPLWEDKATDTDRQKQEKQIKRDSAYSLYGSNRPFVNRHWEKLKTVNGGRTLMCPLCGLTQCTEMDHYMPRAVFHEYSAYVGNLIPLCHGCNQDKHDDWTDTKGKRIFFNAFYDKPAISIVKCDIIKSNGLPKAKVTINPALDKNDYSDAVVLRTIGKLKLLGKFQIQADVNMRSEIARMRTNYACQKAMYKDDRQVFWREQAKLFIEYTSQPENFDFLQMALFKAIANSKIMENWVVSGRDFLP